MFAVVRLFWKWLASLTGVRVGLPIPRILTTRGEVDRALRQAREAEEAYRQYATSEGLETMGDAGRLPLHSVNESFYSRQ